MFAWKLKRLFQEEARELTSATASYNGANRRAINLVPLPVAADNHEIANTNTVRYHQLLVSIEGNQRTCCLKIISPRTKSRSALLIFRGRVVGCLYGKRAMDYHFFHQDAHQRALADLATPGNILDAYQLPEDLVLAAASLFHGQVLDFSRSPSVEHTYETAIQQIMSFGLPGCVVVSTPENEMVCMVYLAGGKIIGVYSSRDGWVQADFQSGARYVASTPRAQVMASILAIRTVDDVARMGFSLTGLGDRRYELMVQPSYTRTRATETASIRPRDVYESKHAQQLSPVHYPASRRLQSTSQHGRHAHAIHP